MRFCDMKRESVVDSLDRLDAVLAQRYGSGVNSFWFRPDNREFPELALLVNGDLAYCYYVPYDGHAGFHSLGHVQGLERDGMTEFFMLLDCGPDEMINESVVPVADAIAVAREFFVSTEMPRAIEWFEL